MNKLSESILLRYLQNQSSEEDLDIINKWLNESEENAAKLFELEITFHSGQLTRFSEKDFLDKAENRLFEKINVDKTQPKKKKIFFIQLIKYAAVVAVLITGVIGFTYLIESKPSVNEVMVTVAPEDSIKEVVLPDGSRVWLNHLAVLKYPESFEESSRSISLEGEAYFEVVKDKTKPFIVKSEAIQVKVLGTSFNIKCNKGDRMAEATLITGEIEVKCNNDKGQIVLSPGQKAELDKITGRLQVREVNAKLDAIWYNNFIPFDNATIFEIANALEYLYNVKIILSPNFGSNRYSGVLKRKESIDSVLNSLMNSIPFTYKCTGDNIYIQPSFK